MEKSDGKKYFSWGCFLLKPPLLFFLVILIPFVALFCFSSSYGISPLFITVAILFISTYVLFLRFFKKKTRLCMTERSEQEEEDDDDDDDDDDDEEEEEEDGLIEIALMSEDEGEKTNNDLNMEEDNLIEIDISIGSIKRRSI